MTAAESKQRPSLGPSFNALPVVASMGYLSMLAMLVFNGMPVIVGTLGSAYGLTNDRLGVMASAFLAGNFLMVCTSVFWIRRVDWRRACMISIVTAFAFCSVLLFDNSYDAFVVVFFVMGPAMACLFVPLLAYFSDLDEPVRGLSIAILFGILGSALFAYAMPNWITPRWGIDGLIWFLMIALLTGLILVHLVPKSGRIVGGKRIEGPTGYFSAFQRALPALAGLSLLAIFYFGVYGLWPFMERIGTANGLSEDVAGSALGLSLLIGGASALAATLWLGDRIGYVKPLYISGGLWTLFILMLAAPFSALSFTVALILFNLAWNFGSPYQLAIIARADSEGTYFVLMQAFQGAGAAAGPYIAGMLSPGDNYSAVYTILAVSVIISIGGFSVLGAGIGLTASPSPRTGQENTA